jgi:hypothetical protein
MTRGNGDSRDGSGTLRSINWKRELLLIGIGSILGGLLFTAISPFVVPAIHDFQVNQLGAQNPTVGVEVEYAEDVDGEPYSVPPNETYDRYIIRIQNPSKKQVSSLTVAMAFPGVIEEQEIGGYQAADETSYSQNARLVATDPPDNASYATNAIKLQELPPLKSVSVVFLIDRTPEKRPVPGYWGTAGLESYNASRGSLMLYGQYRWQFKGSVYTEVREFTYVDTRPTVAASTYDYCIGERATEICAG